MSGFPPCITGVNHTAPVPRRIRGMLANRALFDTTRAVYVWEWPHYPNYYIPRAAVEMSFLTPDGDPRSSPQGDAQEHHIHVGNVTRHAAARLILTSPIDALRETVRFEWGKLDRWFEEDEEVFVHPRDPYTRVDALRSTRTVRVELDGIILAESSSPVMVFETGLPPRSYVNFTEVRFEHLVPSRTRTECPYKGRTTGYWSAVIGGKVYSDLAWTYSFPTRQLLPIAGLVAFLDEKVDVFIDGVEQPRPRTHMS